MKTFRPPRMPQAPAPRRDGRPDYLGPTREYRGPIRPLLSRPAAHDFRGYGGHVVLQYGRAVGGVWRDGAGQLWAWGTEA